MIEKDHEHAPAEVMTFKAARDAAVELAARKRANLVKVLP
ncbi:hypothetical protein ACVIW2_004429 [Bradyrhizobium huanghuaihaiense]|jgi:hypothetical protein|uniref:Uncharacterized protein n=5 Tax=Bradyrhizobium TaxID=374 RepID=A0ABV4FTC8_9BRAD|nr:hypothetical protein [Bradyrhizobium japonicum]MCS3899712.1 hypothetical protein [Bradyrhizobium japonicum USDA 38]MCS3933350.1 hypothetical protein [Bradyrhizobium elkanii]TWH90435.1 hypothetical protein IQ17_07485 [Bradyrhizobium daqingense]TWI53934.1 hypothetical protein IQ16_08725 [Bradyrhizobium huanghuaihaiense]BAR56060.1 hypothetical protein NK6_2880 [Bradyrhizobium diazoefficiens]GLR93559.1 hypothetical protein GCM10007858_11860 [Bradyrhizobium liaoningense]